MIRMSRTRRAWRVAAVVCLLASVAPAAVAAGPAPATPPVEATAPVEALLIGDSVMHGMAQSYSAGARALLAARHSFLLESAGCRRLITTSCRILPSPAPTNAMTVLKARAGRYNRVLVIGAGYNDPTTGSTGIGSAVDAIVAEARRQGIGAVIWLTYREAGPSRSRFRAHNNVLRQKLAVYPDLHLADWAATSAFMPTSWFSADGIHLGGSAASGMAKLIADTIDRVPSLRDRCAPWNVGGFAAPTDAPSTAVVDGGVNTLAAPVRLADTRSMNGKIGAGKVLPVIVAGANGVPADAAGAIVTITAVRPCANVAVTAYPCEGGPPLASMLNAAKGSIVAGSAIVRLGAGALCVLVSQPTDLLVDLTGWVSSLSGEMTAVGPPQRLVDTRAGETQATTVPQTPLTAGQHLTVDLDGVIGVDAATTAVTVNLITRSPSAAGFLSVSPGVCGTAVPTTSTVNVAQAVDVAAATTVALTDGALCVYSSVATDITLDLQAVHGTPAGPLVIGSPVRLADTRGGTLVGPEHVLEIDPAAPPSGAASTMPALPLGAVLSVIAVGPTATTEVFVGPCSAEAGAPQLLVAAGATTANRITVPIDEAAGPWCVTATTPTHIVVDLEAWVSDLTL
ncbi:MAG: hypothetical protein ABMA25_04260 [Ilumatobacteraceae bacterium]